MSHHATIFAAVKHNSSISHDHPEHSVAALAAKHKAELEAHGHTVEFHVVHPHGHGHHGHGHSSAA